MHAFCLFIENVFLQIPDKPDHLRDYSVGFGAPRTMNGINVLQLRLRSVIEGVLYFIFLEKSGEPHGLPPAEPIAGGGGQKSGTDRAVFKEKFGINMSAVLLHELRSQRYPVIC